MRYDDIDSETIREARELLNYSNEKILALALMKNQDTKDNIKTAVSLNLKNSLLNLNNELKSLRKSLNWSSWVMGAMTFIILCLTLVLILK